MLLQPPHPTPAPTRLCLVRHGETDWNAEKRIQGQIDIALNATGRRQARALRQGLEAHEFAAVYSSNLGRAWETASLAVEGVRVADAAIRPAPLLRERHYGNFQGLTPADALRTSPEGYEMHRRRVPDYRFGDGESLQDFACRVMQGLAQIARTHAGETVLAFTHGGVLDVVHRAASGRALDAPRDFAIPNAGLNWIELAAGRWSLLAWADCRHLGHALDEVLE